MHGSGARIPWTRSARPRSRPWPPSRIRTPGPPSVSRALPAEAMSAMHALSFLEPGHFHAALTLGRFHPNVREEIFVYAPPGAELDDFLGLIDAFNRRPERPTAWKPVVRAGDRALE